MWIMMFYTGLKQTSNFLVWKPLLCYIHDSSNPFPCFLLPVTSQVLHASEKCQTLDSSRAVVLLRAHSKMVMGIPSWDCSSIATARVIAVATNIGECKALWGKAWAPIVQEKLHMNVPCSMLAQLLLRFQQCGLLTHILSFISVSPALVVEFFANHFENKIRLHFVIYKLLNASRSHSCVLCFYVSTNLALITSLVYPPTPFLIVLYFWSTGIVTIAIL